MELVHQTELELEEKDRTIITIHRSRDALDFVVDLLEDMRMESIGRTHTDD